MRRAALLFASVVAAACSTGDVSATCTAGQVECAGNTLRTCNAAGTGFSETVCDVACVNNACQLCQANQNRCEGQLSLTCKADGSGWSQQTCQSGCDATTGLCKTQVCTPNQPKCSGNSVMTCKADGSGYDVTNCDYGCDGATNACKTQAPTCTPGTTSCNGSKLVTCNASGTGQTEQLCEFGCDWAANPNACKTAACDVGQKRCSPTEPKQVETCKADRTAWVPGTICPGTCTNGECQAPPNCTAGEQVCRQKVNGDVHRDEIDECTAAGQWQTAKTVCTTGSCVDQGGTPKKFACGTCWKGERTCSTVGDDVLTCTDPMAGATLAYSCWTTDICMYGSCATPLTLVATKSENLVLLAQAFVDCWQWYMNQGVTKDEMCHIIDGLDQTQAVSFDDVSTWVCSLTCTVAADAAHFTGLENDCKMAQDRVGCGFWNNSEITWRWDPLPGGTFMDACIWYRPSGSILFDDEDMLDRCTNFVQ